MTDKASGDRCGFESKQRMMRQLERWQWRTARWRPRLFDMVSRGSSFQLLQGQLLLWPRSVFYKL